MAGVAGFLGPHLLDRLVTGSPRTWRVVVLRDGHIIESGRHREFVQNGGCYASLVRHQTKGIRWPRARSSSSRRERRHHEHESTRAQVRT